MKFFSKRNLYTIVLLVSLAAMLGSLYFSEIVGLTPCELCWYQRILMYPIAILAIVALVLRDAKFPRYVLPMSIMGMIVAGYHYLLQFYKPAAENSFINCTKGSVACSTIDISFFNFITIPLLSFAAFLLITVALYLSLRIDRYR
jgi:disulfide bond formation protein DsbB